MVSFQSVDCRIDAHKNAPFWGRAMGQTDGRTVELTDRSQHFVKPPDGRRITIVVDFCQSCNAANARSGGNHIDSDNIHRCFTEKYTFNASHICRPA